ncbi:hypothetical protein AGMMS49574_11390 [Bacteroidia bacterium]|nr:hypothetical protein AGMMS49574_11390 [Bacteroidia bacterium]
MISQEKLIDIPCEHDKLSILYHVEVEQMQIREAAYNYFFDMQQKVESTGSLFSPILTTGISGNIRCLNDPERMIIGYIDVSTRAKRDMYVWEKDGYFEAPQQICPSLVTLDGVGGAAIYILGESFVESYLCVVCRKRENASKNKPDGWPTRHL